MAKVFISYRREDTGLIAGRIFEKLEGALGKGHVFYDIDAMPFGVDFVEHIDRWVSEAQVVLALVGKSWLTCKDEHGRRRLDDPNDFVRLEIEAALRRGIPLGAVLIGAPMPRAPELPESLAPFCRRHATTVDPGRDFHTHMDRLITDVRRHLEGGATTTNTAHPATKPQQAETKAAAPVQPAKPKAAGGPSPAKPKAAAKPSATPPKGAGGGPLGTASGGAKSDEAQGKSWSGLLGEFNLFGSRPTPDPLLVQPEPFPFAPSLKPPTTGEPANPNPAKTLEGHSDPVIALAISPDGRQLLSGDVRDGLIVWDAASGRQLAQVRDVSPYSIDTRGTEALIGGIGGAIDIVSIPDGKRVRSLVKRNRLTSKAAWMPDGASVIIVTEGHWLERRDARTGAELWRVRLPSPPEEDSYIYALAVSPDGRRVVAGGFNKIYSLHDTSTGRLLCQRKTSGGTADCSAFFQDNDGLALMDGDDIRLVTSDDLSQDWHGTGCLKGHSDEIASLALSPNGRWLVSGSRDKTVRAWDMQAGGESTILGRHNEVVRSVAVSPDGRWVASAGGAVVGGKDFTIRTWPLPA